MQRANYRRTHVVACSAGIVNVMKDVQQQIGKPPYAVFGGAFLLIQHGPPLQSQKNICWTGFVLLAALQAACAAASVLLDHWCISS
jgi:hypothetical protein